MPKIRRRELPPRLLDHLLERARQRHITFEDATELYRWLGSDPSVPDGRWFKRFPKFTICGEGDLIKTLLTRGQLPDGEEVA